LEDDIGDKGDVGLAMGVLAGVEVGEDERARMKEEVESGKCLWRTRRRFE
jgi:hypothetical protein